MYVISGTFTEREQRFSSLMDNNPAMIFTIDKLGRIEDMNASAERDTGYPLSEVARTLFLDFLDNEHRDEAMFAFKQALSGVGSQLEARFRCKSGHLIYVGLKLVPITVHEMVQGFYAIARDITELRRDSAALLTFQARLASQHETLMQLVNSTVINSGKLESAIEEITCALSRVLNAGRVSVWFRGEDAVFCPAMYIQKEHRHAKNISLSLSHEHKEWIQGVLEESRVLVVKDAQNAPFPAGFYESYLSGEQVEALLVVPIRFQRRVIGSIWIGNIGGIRDWFPDEQVFAASVADMTALAVTNHEALQMTKRLQESERRSAEAQEIAHVGHWDWNIETDETTWSDELFRLVGEEPQSFTVESFHPFVHPEDLPRLEEAVNAALHGASFDMELRVIRRDGEERVIHEKARVEYNDVGEPIRMFGTTHDITEQKRVERQLREKEARFRLMMENSTDLMMLLDTEGIVHYASPAHEWVLGYKPEELTGKPVQSLLWSDDKNAMIEAFVKLLDEPKNVQSEFRYEHRDGYPVVVEARARPVLDETGNVTNVMVVARDIMDRKKTEELLLKSEKLSIAGQLAAGVAHEIRNPLTSLKGFVQLIRFDGMAKQHYVDIMTSELNRIESIVSEMLVLAKPHAASFRPAVLHSLIEHVIALLEPQALLHNVELNTAFQTEHPVVMNCDENQLKQVFINIAKNAIDAMPTGGHVRFCVEKVSSEQVRVQISDDGPGMPKDRIAKLGEPFFTTKESGTGLGLMVSYKIIENHSGRLAIDSTEGVGTTVSVYLPI